MANIEIAISKDLEKNYLEAVKYYELALQDNIPSADAYINLGFLYWEFAAEFTFNTAYNIPDKWSKIGGEKYPKIIEVGLKQYPESVELHFWKKYFPHRHYFDDFSQKDCERIIEESGDDGSIVPYFFLYLFDKVNYKEKRDQLLKQCEKLPTAKNEYIKSIIK